MKKPQASWETYNSLQKLLLPVWTVAVVSFTWTARCCTWRWTQQTVISTVRWLRLGVLRVQPRRNQKRYWFSSMRQQKRKKNTKLTSKMNQTACCCCFTFNFWEQRKRFFFAQEIATVWCTRTTMDFDTVQFTIDLVKWMRFNAPNTKIW